MERRPVVPPSASSSHAAVENVRDLGRSIVIKGELSGSEDLTLCGQMNRAAIVDVSPRVGRKSGAGRSVLHTVALADWQFFVYVGKLKAWLCLSRQRTIWRTLEFQVSTQPDAMSGPATVGGVPIDDAPAMVHTT